MRGGDTIFYDGVKTSDLISRAHVLKRLHEKMISGPSEKKNHEGTLWRLHRSVTSFILTRKIFLHIYRHGYRFYNRYTNKKYKKYLYDDGTGVKPKYFLQRGIRYAPVYDTIQQMCDID